MRGRWQTRQSRLRVDVHLIVDETPLPEEGVGADHHADVAGQVPPAGPRGELLGQVEALRVDLEVAVAERDLGGLLVKKVNFLYIKPLITEVTGKRQL